jgi:heterogeneous nuclear ribonucleoprotein F/H
LEDILILFQGLVVIDVVLVGQGEAFVIFANPMDYQMALQRYVFVFECAVFGFCGMI